MTPPAPPPKTDIITKDDRGRQVFDRWLFQFWTFATGGTAGDSTDILATREFARQPVAPTLAGDSQRVLEGQIFGG